MVTLDQLVGSDFVAVGEFNIGELDDFRVPDAGVLPVGATLAEGGIFFPTAILVAEVLSPRDDSYRKLGFYFRRGVCEVLLVDSDADAGRVIVLVRGEHEFELAGQSAVLGASAEQLTAMIIRSEAPR